MGTLENIEQVGSRVITEVFTDNLPIAIRKTTFGVNIGILNS